MLFKEATLRRKLCKNRVPAKSHFRNQFYNTKFFLISFQSSLRQLQKISVANITDGYKEYFYVGKVVAKKMTGGNPALTYFYKRYVSTTLSTFVTPEVPGIPEYINQ